MVLLFSLGKGQRRSRTGYSNCTEAEPRSALIKSQVLSKRRLRMKKRKYNGGLKCYRTACEHVAGSLAGWMFDSSR